MEIIVYSQKDKFILQELSVHVFSQKERTRRSLIKLFSWFGIAGVSILIPVFHFILVPLFLLLAPFLALKSYKEQVRLEACSLLCPECRQLAHFAKNTGEWPLHNNCPHCMNRIYFKQRMSE